MLRAQGDVHLYSDLVGTGSAQLALEFGQATADGAGSDYHLHNASRVYLPEGRNFSIRQGNTGSTQTYQVVTRLAPDGVPGSVSYREINNDTAGLYALGASLQAAPTTSESPLGGFTGSFTGQFHGLGHSISGLGVSFDENYLPAGVSGIWAAGMFSTLGVGAVARDFGLLAGHRSASGKPRGDISAYAGGVAGINHGLIHKVHVTSHVTGRRAVAVGGLVGLNTGVVRQSFFDGGGSIGTDSTFTSTLGALVGINQGRVEDAFAFGSMLGSGLTAIGDNSRGQASRVYITHPTFQVIDSNVTRSLDEAAMRSASTFAGWDIDSDPDSDSIWRIHEGASTPLLRDLRRRVNVDTHVTYDGQVHSDGPVSARNAGVYTAPVDITPLGREITGAMVIDPAALTVSSSDVNREYDGTTEALRARTAVVSGTLFGGDGLTGGRFAFADPHAGTGKTVQVSDVAIVDGNGGGNYTLTLLDNTSSTITPAALEIRADPTSKTYDGNTDASTIWRMSGGRLFGGDTLGGLQFRYDSAQVGIGKTLLLDSAVLEDGNGGANYNLVLAANTAGTIVPAELVVTALDDQRVADGQPYQGGNGFTTRGWVLGEDDRLLQGGVVYGGTAQGAVVAGSYSIVPSGLGSPNYSLRFEDGMLVISAMPVEVEEPKSPPQMPIHLPELPELPELPVLLDPPGLPDLSVPAALPVLPTLTDPSDERPRATADTAWAGTGALTVMGCGLRLPLGVPGDDCR